MVCLGIWCLADVSSVSTSSEQTVGTDAGHCLIRTRIQTHGIKNSKKKGQTCSNSVTYVSR